MGDQFTDGEKQWRREQRRKEAMAIIVKQRTEMLIRHLTGKMSAPDFIAAYMASAEDDGPFIHITAADLVTSCKMLRDRKREHWATALWRLWNYPEEYAALKAISPFKDALLIEMDMQSSDPRRDVEQTVLLRGATADLYQVYNLMHAGNARFRKIGDTGYFVVTKAKYAPVRESRDFRDG